MTLHAWLLLAVDEGAVCYTRSWTHISVGSLVGPGPTGQAQSRAFPPCWAPLPLALRFCSLPGGPGDLTQALPPGPQAGEITWL